MNYLILDLREIHRRDEYVFWRPNNAGYTSNVGAAGRYTRQQVRDKSSYYDNKVSTLAIPEVAVLKLVTGIVITSAEALKAMRDARNAANRNHAATARALNRAGGEGGK